MKLKTNEIYTLVYPNGRKEENATYVGLFKEEDYSYSCVLCDKEMKNFHQFNIRYGKKLLDYESRFFGTCCIKKMKIKGGKNEQN